MLGGTRNWGKTELPHSDQIGITFAVNVASQFLSAPMTTHLEWIMRILRYLKKTPGRELLFSDQGSSSRLF